ncbi:GntR family transcriptional regulator [Comamonas endophytica]|uniref:GntR family transcriptional regulator n=1 Tax=Comamonas endophytica TaxID=2949090 RepID=A0ABY6G6R5_9BURK|nr:GntR family transcriptional regulator [Acidovorax sp. 5MLIR]MCD2512404.1 GntR family transcriptional regulator [Acidovorax sp. D4N7]UYG50149.1 GntR family transcriptional regulator [Acidovorax sp. 5MLIR]
MTQVSLAASAYAQLKEALDNFHFVPGDRFSENEVSALLGMSRTPIREALVRLQREGYISVMPKLGWLVNSIDFHVFEQLYDVRSVLECAAIDLLGAAPDLAQRLAPLCELWCVDASQRLATCTAVSQMDEAFHMALVHASGNLEMARIHCDLTERIRVVRRLEFTRSYRIDAAYDEHARILQTLLTRDTLRTKALLQQHIAVSRDEVRKITLHTLQGARQARVAA